MSANNEIQEIIDAIFSCDFYKDFDKKINGVRLQQLGNKLIEEYGWENVCPVWQAYAYNHLDTFESLENFARLSQTTLLYLNKIPNACEFAAFFMYRWDLRDRWDEGGNQIEDFLFTFLYESGHIDMWNCVNENIFEDEEIAKYIAKWREKDGRY